MLYWIIFLTVALILSAISLNTRLSENQSIYFQYALIILLIYFSGFRDGLGQDYDGYYEYFNLGYNLSFSLRKPIMTLFSNIIYSTIFSSQFFFLIMAIVTNILFIKSFYRYKNTFLIIFIYLTGTIFYFNTFNLVNQMCAASIFVYSIRYIEDRQILKYFLLILLGASIHTSAIFLMPIYFIVNRNYSKTLLLFILALSIYIGQIEQIDLAPLLSKHITLYYWYFNNEPLAVTSGYLTLFLNICLIILLTRKKLISSDIKNNIAFNLFFIGVVFYNLIPSYFYIFRFAIYFIVFATIVLPLLRMVISKQISRIILITTFSIIFGLFIYNNLNNKIIVPDKILPITSIFDK